MAHAHDHAHDHEHSPYYLDQLCTIGVCGALGMVAVRLWWTNSLGILAGTFQQALLAGGVVLLVVTAVRAVSLWHSVGRAGHAHDHACDHDHGHGHAHTHDCGHEHHHAHEHAITAAPHEHGVPAEAHAAPA